MQSVPRSTPSRTADLTYAERVVAARCERSEFAGFPDDAQITAIVDWLQPLPAGRWSERRRRRYTPTLVGPIAQAVHDALQPPAGTDPQPVCSRSCYVTHAIDDQAEVA
jgi:hypothetical protein